MCDKNKLSPEDLTHPCDPQSLGFETTADVAAAQSTVGQERATSSIDFGLGIRTEGFNLYVAGRPGTGRNSSVKAIVGSKAKNETQPSDWCYVNNFQDPYRPKAIRLGAGRGPELAGDMAEFLKVARVEIPRAFESENYEKKKADLLEMAQHRREAMFTDLQQNATSLGFSIEATPVGIASVPLTSDGKSYTREDFDPLPDEQKQEIKKRGAALQENINGFVARTRQPRKGYPGEAARTRQAGCAVRRRPPSPGPARQIRDVRRVRRLQRDTGVSRRGRKRCGRAPG